MTFAALIRNFRERRSLKLTAVAHGAGIHEATLWNIETGKRGCSEQTAKAICLALGLEERLATNVSVPRPRRPA